MCMYVHIPVFFTGEDRDNRGLKDCDLYQSCILHYRLTMIVCHHHQLSNKYRQSQNITAPLIPTPLRDGCLMPPPLSFTLAKWDVANA